MPPTYRRPFFLQTQLVKAGIRNNVKQVKGGLFLLETDYCALGNETPLPNV